MSRASKARKAREERRRARGRTWRAAYDGTFWIPAGSYVNTGSLTFNGKLEDVLEQLLPRFDKCKTDSDIVAEIDHSLGLFKRESDIIWNGERWQRVTEDGEPFSFDGPVGEPLGISARTSTP